MFEISIKLPNKPEKVGQLSEGVYRIGSSPAAHIQISQPEVSARHAILTVRPDGISVEDAGSTNGTLVDGRRLKSAQRLHDGSQIQIGNAIIGIRWKAAGAAPAAGEAPAPGSPGEAPAAPAPGSPAAKPESGAVAAPPARGTGYSPRAQAKSQMIFLSGIRFEYRKVVQLFKRRVHDELLKRVNLKNLTLSGADNQEIANTARSTIQAILRENARDIPSGVSIQILEEELVHEAVGLGCIEKLLADETVTEVMVNGHNNVYVEKSGNIYKTDLAFADDQQLLTVIERIVAPLGRRIDESQPLVDARLKDGSRVNAIIPPLAIDGPSLTIRKFSREPYTVDVLIKEKHSLSQEMADFLRLCVLLRKNIIISGGTGSGKTTLLSVVSNFLPNEDRIVTIEDAAELRLMKEHVVRLEARPPNIEGRGEITIRDLVRNALRMRPDRIVVGECRGGEALDMLQAMNTGHDGSLTTVHANTPRDALARLETLVLMAGFDLPLRAIREQISSAVQIIVQIERMRGGARKIVEITEVTGMEGEVITTQELFRFDQEGVDADGAVLGHHVGCGIIPTFVEEFHAAGLSFDIGIFRDTRRPSL